MGVSWVGRRNTVRTSRAVWMPWYLYERDIGDRVWTISFLREAFWSSRHQRLITQALPRASDKFGSVFSFGENSPDGMGRHALDSECG